MDRHLSPAETAKRFGISIKALRLYEAHGLLKPLRTTNGSTGAAWRVYGTDQIARLVQILALKRLGFSLAHIGELLSDADTLDPILALQERLLVEDGERVTRALALIRKAKAKRAAGETLSIDDLANLAQETVMTKQLTSEERREIEAPFRKKHFTPEENDRLEEWRAERADLFEANKNLLQEAKLLMDANDTTSATAMDFARRFQANADQLKASVPPLVPDFFTKSQAAWKDLTADPEASQKISPLPEVYGFVAKIMANYRAREQG